MRFFYATASVVTLIVLQACSGQSVKGNKSSVVTEESAVDEIRLIKTTGSASAIHGSSGVSSNDNLTLTVPEAQIIRELYQSGCSIEDIEINRRKQQMRISCASDKSRPFGSSI